MPKNLAVDEFNLSELQNYGGDKVAFYKYGGQYGWAVFHNDSDWQDVIEYGMTDTIEEQLDDDMIAYIMNHADNWEQNSW